MPVAWGCHSNHRETLRAAPPACAEKGRSLLSTAVDFTGREKAKAGVIGRERTRAERLCPKRRLSAKDQMWGLNKAKGLPLSSPVGAQGVA